MVLRLNHTRRAREARLRADESRRKMGMSEDEIKAENEKLRRSLDPEAWDRQVAQREAREAAQARAVASASCPTDGWVRPWDCTRGPCGTLWTGSSLHGGMHYCSACCRVWYAYES